MPEVMKVIRTKLKTVGNGESEDDIVHRHEQFWTLDGDLLAENCEGGYCSEYGGNEDAE